MRHLVTLYSALTDIRSHELNKLKLDRATSMHFEKVAARHGLNATPIEMAKMFIDMLAMPVDETVHRAAIAISVRELEDKLREAIQAKCSDIDGRKGQPFGTTNGAVKGVFKKSRTDMSLAELQAVWAYVNTLWDEAAGL